MRISYRQGLVSAQADFLQIGQVDTRYVDLIVSPTPTIAVLSSGTKDYLISEQRTVTNAWGPFNGASTQYLYWEINPATGQLSRGSSTLPVISSATEPLQVIGQMWWDQTTNIMKVFNGVRWTNTLRVLAGVLQSGGILVPETFVSQVSLNTPVSAGFILTDGLGIAYKNASGDFLTTDTSLTSVDTGSVVKLDGAQVIVQANENIPKFSLVYLVGGRAALASGTPPEAETKSPIGMVTTDAYQNDAVNIVTSGKVVVNEQWNWAPNLWGQPVYCGSFGEVIAIKPSAQKNVRVGTIVGKQNILLMLDWETEVAISSGGIAGINTILPISKSGSPDFPTISMQRASPIFDGFLSASDFARIPAIEISLTTKSDIAHTHIITDVAGLDVALANKSDISHTHVIADTIGLQLELDQRSLLNHKHVKADISDLQPTIDDINIRITNKADKVFGAVAGNFASLDAGGNLNDSGRSPFDYALNGHTHIIPEVNGLQLALDGKADIIHAHIISDVTNLQNALDDKSYVGHTHEINDVNGLQLALNLKSDVGHEHLISNIVGLQDVLDNKSDLNHTHIISQVIGLQAELNNKSDLGHTHVIAEINGLQIVLDNKANLNHLHTIAEVSGLQSELNNKSDLGHTHIINDVTGLQSALNSKAPLLHVHTLANSLTDVDVNTNPAILNDYLGWNGSHWVPTTLPLIAGPQGPVGPQGIQGPAGPQGPAGSGGSGSGFTPLIKTWGGPNYANPIPRTGPSPYDIWKSTALPVNDLQVTPIIGDPDPLSNVTLISVPFNEFYSSVGTTNVAFNSPADFNSEWLVNIRAKLKITPSDPYQGWNGYVRVWAKINYAGGVELPAGLNDSILGTYDWVTSSNFVNASVILSYGGDTSFLEHQVNVVWPITMNFESIDFYISNFLDNPFGAPLSVDFSSIKLTKITPTI